MECKTIISNWLAKIGLKLKDKKTKICHTLKTFESNKAGFDFLGFNIRHYQRGKAKTMKSTNGEYLGYTLRITPSKASIKKHSKQLKDVIRKYKAQTQSALIAKLNPIINGWANYYKSCCCTEAFAKCDYLLWQKLRSWAKRRHNGSNNKKVFRKYWSQIGNNKWEFITTYKGKTYTLSRHSKVKTERYNKIAHGRSLYDNDWIYWGKRLSKLPTLSTKKLKLLKRQKGKCNYCKHYFTPNDLIEVDHITPKFKGGNDTYKNLQLLHRHCHDKKSAEDMK